MIFVAISMIVLLLIGVDVAFAMAITTTVFIFMLGGGLNPVVIAQRIVSGSNTFILLAVPFFILAGELMNTGGVTKRLVKFAEAIVGSVVGGLSYVVVIVNMIMAGVSGAAIADAAAVGSVMIPSMTQKGYSKGFAAALNAAAATIGPVIPPSVGFLIYASLADTNVGEMFLAGAVPGFVMGVYMLAVCFLVSKSRHLPRGEKTSPIKIVTAVKDSVWALLMPIIIVGGIVGGIVTPTEAGVIAVIYGFFITLVVYRELKLRDIPRVLVKAGRHSAVIIFVMACAQTFGWILTREGVTDVLISTFRTIASTPWQFLLLFNALILLLGCVMEGGTIMIILTPLMMPILRIYGINIVQFGVIFQLNIMIGLLTPPIGMLLFVITGISGVKMAEMLKELIPFYVVLVIILLMITFIPQISLWLPGLLL
ncbi:MAG: TRAP transporter large permease [Lentisphaerae bacterium]|nr:TRAP transporter large permease [Lentisphaerota bacterium]